jgi:hypothetical protein
VSFTTGLGLLMGIALGMWITASSSESRIASAVGKRMTAVEVQQCTKADKLTLTRKD